LRFKAKKSAFDRTFLIMCSFAYAHWNEKRST